MRLDQLLLRALIVAMIGLAPIGAPLAGAPMPHLVNGINDPDRYLSAQQTTDLGKKLAAFEQQKNIQVVVLIVSDLGFGSDREHIDRYSERALKAWTSASGSSGQVVLLAVEANHNHAWIAEQHTDLGRAADGGHDTVVRIVWETMFPRFKANDIGGGIDAGLDQLISVLNGNPLPAPPEPTGVLHELSERLDSFRYGMQVKLQVESSESVRLFVMLGLAVGVALGIGLRRFAGRWPAALLAAAVAGVGSWLQYNPIVPFAAVAFVIVFGWNTWFGKGGNTTRSR